LRINEIIVILHAEVVPVREKAKKIHYDAESEKIVDEVRKKTVVPVLMASGGTVHKEKSIL
jgi:hypothetical protein